MYLSSSCRKGNLRLVALCLALCSALYGQSFEPYRFNPFSEKAAGFHVVNASVSGSYSTGAQSLGLGDSLRAPGRGDIGFLQGTVVLGWSRRSDTSNISVIYAPSIARAANSSGYRSINHTLSISGSRPLAPRWMFEYSGGLIASDFNLLLAARAPRRFATFDELTAAIVSASAGSFQLADFIAALPFASSPENAYLFGGRHMSVSGNATASFESSSRSHVRMSIYGMRSRVVTTEGEGGGGPAALLRRTRSVNGSVGWTYAITPRTFSSINVSSGRVGSEFNEGWVSHATMSLGRKLNERWYVQVTGGAGNYKELSGFRRRQFLNQEYGASLGYKLYAHTVAANFGRRVGDDYGLGAKVTYTGTAAWTWARPGRRLTMSGNFGYAQLFADDLPSLTSWTGILSLSRALGNGFGVGASYRYVRFPQALFLRAAHLGISGAVGTLSWSPER